MDLVEGEERELGAQYADELGLRLRNVRQQQQLSLHDVEERSDGELKASVVGAYERGERSVSVARLRTLADFYDVPVGSLLPEPGRRAPQAGDQPSGLMLDLTRLDLVAEDEVDRRVVERYAAAIQAQRGDYNGRVLTVRASDVRALAAVLDRDVEDLRASMVSSGAAREG